MLKSNKLDETSCGYLIYSLLKSNHHNYALLIKKHNNYNQHNYLKKCASVHSYYGVKNCINSETIELTLDTGLICYGDSIYFLHNPLPF